jgi:hypothetical protein
MILFPIALKLMPSQTEEDFQTRRKRADRLALRWVVCIAQVREAGEKPLKRSGENRSRFGVTRLKTAC